MPRNRTPHPAPRTTIRFGTEGWRGVMGETYTIHNVRRLAQATAMYWRERAAPHRRLRIGVGFDTRFLSDRVASVVAEVLAANDLEVWLADRSSPTPALSALVCHERLDGGVMVTASHNPPQFNGIKVKAPDGGSIEADATQRIEALIDAEAPRRLTRAHGRLRMVNPLPGYLQGLQNFVNLSAIRHASLRVLVDAMHGTGDSLIEQLARGGSTRVTTLHAAPDPAFGGHAPEPIPPYLTVLSARTRQRRAHIGIANDGDADRIGAMRPDGRFLNPGQILCLILLHLLTERRWTGGVVTTISNISWIPSIASEYGLPLYEVPVGFKHIAKLMREDDILIGGEESGGIGVSRYMLERDGILLALLLLEVLAVRRQPLPTILRALERKYGRFEYGRVDLRFPGERRAQLMRRLADDPPTTIAGQPLKEVKTYDGLKLIGRRGEWILFRLSGTEPIVRIYAEAPTAQMTRRLLAWGKTLAKP